MYALQQKIPEFCGYAVTFLAVALMGYTAACAPKPQEQWNSYYYGTTPQMEQGIIYYSGTDADDNYTLPDDMSMPNGDRSLQVEGALHGDAYR
jgi:hypothetical protein